MKFICTSDWHLRKNKPRCRLDSDWIETQRAQIRFIINEANKRQCAIMHCGDIFHTAKVDADIQNILLSELKNLNLQFGFIAGNHDLQYHSIDLLQSSNIYSLTDWAGKTFAMPDYFDSDMEQMTASHFGQAPVEAPIMFIHRLVFASEKEIPPGSDGITAAALLSLYRGAEWIFTGDNHQSFIKTIGGRHLLNPGCLNRQAADLIDYQPVCYYVDTDDASALEIINIPDPVEMVTDEYIQKEDARADRIEAFVEKIHSKENVSLSFIDNVRETLKHKDIDPELKETCKKIFTNGGIVL